MTPGEWIALAGLFLGTVVLLMRSLGKLTDAVAALAIKIEVMVTNHTATERRVGKLERHVFRTPPMTGRASSNEL